MTSYEQRVLIAPGAIAAGFAGMMGQLLQQNLETHPERARLLDRMEGRLAMEASDIGARATFVFGDGRVLVHDGFDGLPDVLVRASSQDLMRLSQPLPLVVVPLLGRRVKLSLPDVRSEQLRELLRTLAERRIEVRGLPWGLPLLVRFGRLLAID